MSSKFGKQATEQNNDAQALKEQELLLKQNLGGKKKRPLIAKEKKGFDSADYFMKGDENGGEGTADSSSLEEGESQLKSHKPKMSSNFRKVTEEPENQEEEDDIEDIETQKQEQEERERRKYEERLEQEEKERVLIEKELKLKKEAEEKQRQEEDKKRKQQALLDEEKKKKEQQLVVQQKQKEQDQKIREQEKQKQEQEKQKRDQEQQLKEQQQIDKQKQKTQQQQNVFQQSNQEDEEERIRKEQEAMMLKLKGSGPKRPLVAKQKKAFDSADYFMKDDHNNEEEQEGQDSVIEEVEQISKMKEKKSKYSKTSTNHSSESDSGKENLSTENPSIKSLSSFQPLQQQGIEVLSPRGSALKSRSGSESRENKPKESKRVSFSLPINQEEQSNLGGEAKEKQQSKTSVLPVSQNHKENVNQATSSDILLTPASTQSENEHTNSNNSNSPNLVNNNVHSLKGSRFLNLPNGIVIENDNDKSSETSEKQSTQTFYQGKQQLEKAFEEQLAQAESFLSMGTKKRVLIARDKRKDFDSADYFLQQEKKKVQVNAQTMFDLGDDYGEDDDDNKQISNSRKRKGKSKDVSSGNGRGEYKKTSSMPLLPDLDKDQQRGRIKEKQSPFRKNKLIGNQSFDENISSDEDDSNLKIEYDEDDDDLEEEEDDEENGTEITGGEDTLKYHKSTFNNSGSLDDEEDFLPKITYSKITNSRFSVYKGKKEEEEEDLQDQDDANTASSNNHNIKEQNKQSTFAQENYQDDNSDKQFSSFQTNTDNLANRITAAESHQLMQEQSKSIPTQEQNEQFPIPLSKHKKNLLSKEKKKEFDSADYFMKDK